MYVSAPFNTRRLAIIVDGGSTARSQSVEGRKVHLVRRRERIGIQASPDFTDKIVLAVLAMVDHAVPTALAICIDDLRIGLVAQIVDGGGSARVRVYRVPDGLA